MSENRLQARLLVDACIKAAAAKGRPAMVIYKGDPEAGAVFVKLLSRAGDSILYGQTRDADGAPGWFRASGDSPTPEASCDERLARERAIDRDLWAVEILADDLEHPLNPKLIR